VIPKKAYVVRKYVGTNDQEDYY